MKQYSYHNNIIDIQNRLPYSKVVYPAIIVLFSLSGVPDYFGRNKISSGGDLSHYSSASLY